MTKRDPRVPDDTRTNVPVGATVAARAGQAPAPDDVQPRTQQPLSEMPGDDHHAAAQPGIGAAVAGLAEGSMDLREASLWGDAWRQLRRRPLFVISALIISIFALMALFPGLFTDADPRSCDLGDSLLRPSGEHIFGTDLLGCDYYSRVVHGARVSMLIGLIVVGLATLIGIILGALAGYYGGWIDTAIARVTDVWFGIPTILGAIVILNLFQDRGLLQVCLVLVVLGWPTTLRLLRSSVLSVKEQDYVHAAKALGATDFRILTRHILPNAIAPVIVYATITVGVIISAEASLSFLGVGLQLPSISWGLMISDAQFRILSAPHLLLFPGGFLSITVLSFILMGDALRDAIDPKLR